MKNIMHCQKGCNNIIKKIHAKGSLKQRLMSFGILRGISITLIQYSAIKSTVEIKIGETFIALRGEEASLIEIEDKQAPLPSIVLN